MKPFGSNVRSALTQADFANVASQALDAGTAVGMPDEKVRRGRAPGRRA
jgi:hypothetical protein